MSQCRCKPPPEPEEADTNRPPPEIEQLLREIDAPVAIVFMRQGGFMAKYPKAAKLHRRSQTRMFKADMDNLTLRWLSPRRPSSKTYLPFTTVDQIIPGIRSTFFKDHEKELGIEIISKWRRLRLVCPNVNEWRLWMKGMWYMWEKAEAKRRRGLEFQKADFIRTLWDLGDTDKSGSLLLDEVVQLAKKLQVQLDARYIALIFQTLDQDKTNVLDYIQFRELVRMVIYSSECNRLFSMYAASKDQIKPDGIKQFLLDVQKEKEPSADLQLKLLGSMDLIGVPKESGSLNEFHWCRLMLSEWNTILDESRLAHCHDMAQPLTQFFIYSADDPFGLPRGQWMSRPVDPLRCVAMVLMRGVRFLRVRLVPSDQDQSAVSVLRFSGGIDNPAEQIDFRAFVAAVKQAAFLTTIYPLILSLDFIGCGMAQREFALDTLLDVCGEDALFRPEPSAVKVPTVESLVKKIVICAPPMCWTGTEPDLLAVAAVSARGPGIPGFPRKPSMPPMPALAYAPMAANKCPGVELWSELSTDTTRPSTDRSVRDPLVGIRARALGTDPGRLRLPMELYSVTADQLAHHVRDDREPDLCQLNTRTLAHCFASGPPGCRRSHGFALAMAVGVQCVTVAPDGMAPLLQQALFWLNGNCGFVSKPRILAHPHFHPFRRDQVSQLHQIDNSDAPQEIRISVIEGRQMPRGPMALVGGPERLCPFVVVSVRGLPDDCVSHETRPVLNNGFAPKWDAPEFAFRVTVPTVSFLCFEVRHFDSGVTSTFLAGAAFVVSTVRQGLRWVPLRDQWARRVPWSGLLVKVTVRPLKYEQSSRPHTISLPNKLTLPPKERRYKS